MYVEVDGLDLVLGCSMVASAAGAIHLGGTRFVVHTHPFAGESPPPVDVARPWVYLATGVGLQLLD